MTQAVLAKKGGLATGQHVTIPRAEAQAIRERLAGALEIIFTAQTILDKYLRQ